MMGNYSAYASYKDSGVEWLGDIPEHWEAKRVKFLVNKIGSGKTPKGGSEIYGDSGIMLIRSQNVYDDGLRLNDVVFIDEKTESLQSNSRVLPDDVLLNITGASIGRVCLVPQNIKKSNVNQHVCILRPEIQKIYPKYLHFLLCSKHGKEQVISCENGTSREGLNFQQAANLIFSIPPLDEQKAIAAFLDYKTQQIDQLIAKKEALLEKLDEKRTALISHAVTKGLDPTVPMKNSGIEWLGDIPKHWARGKLNYFCKLISGGTPDRGNPIFWEGNIPWIKTGEINYQHIYSAEEYITEEGLQSSSTTLVKPETLLMAMYGQGNTRGRVAILKIEAAFNQACLAILPFKNLSVYFLYYYLVSSYKYIRDTGNESSQMNLSAGVIEKINIVIPDLELQKDIVDYLDEKTAEIDQQKVKILQAIDLLKEYRTALITNAVTGKIDVRSVPIPTP